MILVPLLSAICGPVAPCAAAPQAEPAGRYVESRTASVFAGACHYGGERTTAGREALLAWSIDRGSFDGVSLAGLSVAAIVVDEDNLDDSPSARRSIVYVPDSATPAQRDALAGWLRSSAGSTLGAVFAIQLVPLSVSIGAEEYSAIAPGTFDLQGDSLPDHACCKMPFQVWYDPFVALDHRLVGHDRQFVVAAPLLGRAWSRPGENAAFFGRFGTGTNRLGGVAE